MKQIFQDDPRLTAYALGELEGEERAQVEAAVRRDPALRSAVDAIRATARSIETALAAEAAGERPMAEGGRQTAENRRLTADDGGRKADGAQWQRAAIIPGRDLQKLDGGPLTNFARGTKSKLLRFPSLYFVIGSLAAACFAVMVALHEPAPRVFQEKKHYTTVSLAELPTASGPETQAPTGEEPPTGSGAGTSADGVASIKFDARIEKPTDRMPSAPVAQLAENTPGFTRAGEGANQVFSDRLPGDMGETPMPRGTGVPPVGLSESPRVDLRSNGNLPAAVPLMVALRASQQRPDSPTLLAGGVKQVEPPAKFNARIVGPANLSLSGIAKTPRALVLGGPAAAFGSFAGARSALPADRYDWGSAPQATSQYYYYPPDEKFVFRAVPYGSNPLDDKFVYRAVPYGPPRMPAPVASVVRPAPFITEDYAQIRDNDFAAVAVEPLSTFAVDVDSASYTNLRRFLEHGERPPRDAVRIEELVNYFPYRYAPPASGDVPFAASLEVAAAPWNPQHRLVRIGLKTREVSDAARPAANLVFLIDVSGSMAAPAKLPLVQEALRMLVSRLRADDHVAIVTYATQATLALPATPVAHAADILTAVDGLAAKGSTNGAMGLQLAYDVARANVVAGGVNRVILCTDGDFNVGVTQRGDLVRLIEDKAKSGVFLTVLGFGTGNLKDATLGQLAQHGNGIYGYVDSAAEAKRLLVEQAGATLVTVAKDVKVQVEFNPAVAGAYRLIGYENRLLRKQDFSDDRIDAGEIGAGHTVTALYEVVPVGATAALSLASTEPLKYRMADGGRQRAEDGRQRAEGGGRTAEVGGQRSEVGGQWSEVGQPGTRNPEPGTRDQEPGTLSSELLTVKVRYKAPDGSMSQRLEFPLTDRGTTWADASDDFKFAASVAGFGMILRESPYKGTATLAAVAEWARQGLGSDAGGQRNEFLGLVSRAQTVVQ